MLITLKDQRVILLMYKVQNEQHYSTLMQYASKVLKLAENFLNLNFAQCLWFSKQESIVTILLCKLKIAQAIKR